MGQTVVAGGELLVLGARSFGNAARRRRRVRRERCRLTERAGGFVVDRCGNRLPGGTDEECWARGYKRETGWRSGPRANPSHEQREEEAQQRPPGELHAIRVLSWSRGSRPFQKPLRPTQRRTTETRRNTEVARKLQKHYCTTEPRKTRKIPRSTATTSLQQSFDVVGRQPSVHQRTRGTPLTIPCCFRVFRASVVNASEGWCPVAVAVL